MKFFPHGIFRPIQRERTFKRADLHGNLKQLPKEKEEDERNEDASNVWGVEDDKCSEFKLRFIRRV